MTHPLRQHIEEIIPLTDEEFDFVLSHFEQVKKRKHQYIVQEGEFVNKEYWIIKGCLKSYFITDKGKEHILQFGMENWWITDYEAFIKQTKSKISIDCIEDSELYILAIKTEKNSLQKCTKWNAFGQKKVRWDELRFKTESYHY